jgi:hypothetical protein
MVAAPGDFCTQLEQLPSRPVIDGKLDCQLPLRTIEPLDWTSATPIPADHLGARLAVAWHPEGIYFYVEVTDSSVSRATSDNPVWCGDSIEVYVDSDGLYPDAPNYDDPGTIQLIAAAPSGASQPVSRDGERYRDGELASPPSWNNTEHGTYFTDSGYVFEAFVTAEDQDLSSFSLAPGDHIGFDIAINVTLTSAGQAPDCDVHYGQYFLTIAQRGCSTMSCQPHDNSAALCSPMLH